MIFQSASTCWSSRWHMRVILVWGYLGPQIFFTRFCAPDKRHVLWSLLFLQSSWVAFSNCQKGNSHFHCCNRGRGLQKGVILTVQLEIEMKKADTSGTLRCHERQICCFSKVHVLVMRFENNCLKIMWCSRKCSLSGIEAIGMVVLEPSVGCLGAVSFWRCLKERTAAQTDSSHWR